MEKELKDMEDSYRDKIAMVHAQTQINMDKL